MIPAKAVAGVSMLGAGGLAVGVGIASTLPLIMMFSFACRGCGARGQQTRQQYTGKCPKCNQPLRVRDVRSVKVRQQAPTATPENPLDILKVRLAKGDITIAQYNELKEALSK